MLPAAIGHVLDDDRLAERFSKPVRDQPPDNV
jgi:hypothetical protein